MALEPVKSLAISIALLLGSAGALVGTSYVAPAVAQGPEGSFTCRASPANLLGIEPEVANRGGAPCPAESRSVLDLPLASVGVGVASARTLPLPGGGGATARAQVLGVDLSALGLRADLVEAEATVTCEGTRPVLSGTSQVVGLTVGGRPVSAREPAVLSLPIGTLHLNQTGTEGGGLTRRALWLETSLGSVILGEARVGLAGTPCGVPGTITIVVEGRGQPKSFSFTGDLGRFSLRGDGRSTGADRRTFSVQARRYRIVQLEPSDVPRNQGGQYPYTDNWFLEDVRCVDPDGGTRTDAGGSRADLDLDPGEEIVCTFSNDVSGVLSPTDNPTRGLDQPGGAVDDPTAGLDPLSADQGLGSAPPPRSRAGIEPPSAPRGGSAAADGDGDGGASTGSRASLLSTGALVGVPTVLLLVGGGLWFWLVAGGKRRRRDEDGKPA